MNAKLFGISLLAAGVLLTSASQVNASGYTFTDLGTLGGSHSTAKAINNSGQIAGSAWTSSGDVHATIWNGATPTDLDMGALGRTSYAAAINDSGQVAGWSSRAYIPYDHATVWDNGTSTYMNTIAFWVSQDYAYAINNTGQVAGEDSNSRAMVWSNGSPNDLGTLGGSTSVARGINDSGLVVGGSWTANGSYHATVWSFGNGSAITDLGTTFSGPSSANAINELGQIVGHASSSNFTHATLWDGSTITDLGVLREGDRQPGLSTALAINEAGQVVGYSYALDNSDFYMRAFIWNGSTMIDLNSLMAVDTVSEDWHLTSATGINDNGWVVGEAYNSNLNEYHAYLLTPIPVAPVPEPETYAMFMAGLGLMGFIARRRKNGQA